MFSIAAFTALLSLASTSFAQEGASAPSSVAALVAQLRQAPTEVDQFRLIADEDRLFSFTNPNTTVGVTNGAGGHTVAATSENFPAVVGQGVSMTIGFLGPCGMNSPHTHPRATEINFSVNTTLRGGVLVENGARFAEVDIAPGSATVFPQGAIHFEMNPSCEPAMFVAGFNGEDPGVNQVAQRFFGLPPDIVGATLGGLGVQEVSDLEALIPDNVVLGVDECLQRCGITRDGQPTAQRQPRVSANAFPASVTPTNIFSLPKASATAASAAPASAASAASSAAPEASSAAPEASSAAPEASSAASAAPAASASAAAGGDNSTAPAPGKRSNIEVHAPFPEFTQISMRR